VKWTFLKPADESLLEGRPLLDVGTGDGQTLARLVRGPGVVVGLDRSFDALRAAGHTGIRLRVCSESGALPFGDGAIGTVLAGDLFHHLDDEQLRVASKEARRVLRAGGRLVAWWYESHARRVPGAPRFPRTYEAVAKIVTEAGFVGCADLLLEMTLQPAPKTASLAAVA
jgi:SAM-dependent methyltransferase